MSKALWGGRFSSGVDALVQKLSESVSFDSRMAQQDIRGSLAHVKMLAKQSIIPAGDAEKISEGLLVIAKEIEEGKFEWKEELEDVHMNIESKLIERIGDAGARVHTGRSRNDQVNLDVRLYLRESVDSMVESLKKAQSTLVQLAWENKDIIFPGLTHMQHAQPVLFAHYLLALTEMFERDIGRLVDCKFVCFFESDSGFDSSWNFQESVQSLSPWCGSPRRVHTATRQRIRCCRTWLPWRDTVMSFHSFHPHLISQKLDGYCC